MPEVVTVPLEVSGFYRIVPLTAFRKTPGVSFDILKGDQFGKIDGFDRVIHEQGAVSPGPVGKVARPWYMHPYQDDNLLVLYGVRYVDIYSPEHARMESFEVQPDKVIQNGKLVFDGAAMLVWPKGVFHRIKSSDKLGSASLNLAVRYPGFDEDSEFNIYDVDVKANTWRVLRQGHLDQFGN